MLNTRENPYVGPHAFETKDQNKFAGRDRDILALYRLLIADRIVLLFSPSGAGKSSLVNAGLLPRMSEKGFNVLPVVRVNLPLPDELVTQGGANRYVMSVLQGLEETQLSEQEMSNEQLAALTINDYLTRRLRPENPLDDDNEEIVEPKSLLIFDQFEEILTIDPNDDKGKREFFAQLGVALEASRRWALFVVREDYVAALDPYRRFLPTRLANTYRLDLLDYDSAMEAVRKPASLEGVTYTDSAAKHLVDELRSVRIQRPNGSWEPEPQLGRYVEPVQLQVVCFRLWGKIDEDDTITDEEVSELGSVDESLAEYYAEKVAETAEKVGILEKDVRTWFDNALITPNNIRSQVMWDEGKSGGLDNNAILHLEKSHLIRSESRRGVKWLELAHDRLIKPVRDSNLRWFEKNLSPLQRHAMLWAAEKEPDRLLLRDEELTEAEAWAKDQTLSPNEQKFLEACIDLRERVQAEASKKEAEALAITNKRLRIRSRIAISAAVVAAVLAVVAILAWISAANSAQAANMAKREAEANAIRADENAQKAQQEESAAQQARSLAENRALESDASQLAAQSMLFADTNPQRAMLLALEALKTTQRELKPALPVAQEALRTALGSQSGILLSGHNGQIKTVAISNDEHWLATADSKGYIRIWDLTATDPSDSKSLLKEMEGRSITNVQFSPDGKYFVAGGDDGNIFLWRLPEEPGQKPFLGAISSLNVDSPEEVSAMAFSPDGGWFAAGGSKGRVNLYDVKSFEGDLQPVKLESSGLLPVTVLKFSPDSTKLAGGSQDFLARVWSVKTPKNSPALVLTKGAISSLDFSPDGAYLAIGAEQIIYLWKVDGSLSPVTYQKTASRIKVLAFRPNESTQQPASDAKRSNQQQLFVGRADGSIEVWRGSGNTFAVPSNADILRVIDSEITHFSFSPDGHWLLTGSKDRLARLFDLTDLDFSPRILRRFGDPITAAVISPKGKWISVSSDNNEARLWDLEAGLDTAEPLRLPGGPFALDPEGSMLATGPMNDSLPPVLTWDFADLDQLKKISSEITSDGSDGVRMSTLAISPDGRWLASCDSDGHVRIKDLQNSATTLNVLKGGPNGDNESCRKAKFTLDGHYLIVVEDNYTAVEENYNGKGVIKFWDVSKTDFAKTDPETIDAHEGSITALAFSPDGKWMATGSNGGSQGAGIALLWDMEKLSSGKPTLTIPDHVGWVNTVAFSPNGQWLATGDDNGDIRFQNLSDLKKSLILVHAHQDWVNVVAFNPDGKFLASGSSDGTIRLWSVLKDGIEDKAFTFRGHEGPVWDLVFSLDNKWLASASSDNTVRLWDWSARSRNAIVLKGYGDTVSNVDFTADGRWLVTGSIDGTTRLWHMDLKQLQELACQVVGRNLTEKEWNQFINSGSSTSRNVDYDKTCTQYELVKNAESDEVVSEGASVEVISPNGPVGPPQACSVSGDVPVNLTFTNNSDRTVDIYWIDYNCESVLFGTLVPGDSYEQGTFATHPWVFRDAETGDVLKEFVAGTTDAAVTIP